MGHAASRGEVMEQGSGHWIPSAGSFQCMPASYDGEWTSLTKYSTRQFSWSVWNPCAQPFGMSTNSWLSAFSSVPTHWRYVGESGLSSTHTSKIAPSRHCTSLYSAL